MAGRQASRAARRSRRAPGALSGVPDAGRQQLLHLELEQAGHELARVAQQLVHRQRGDARVEAALLDVAPTT